MSFDAPEKTTVNTDEFVPDPYAIGFAPELIALILADLKLTTYRFGTKYDYLQVGDRVRIQNSDTKEIVGEAEITAKSQMLFKDLPLASGTHEGYRDKEHQREVISGYYAFLGRPIVDEDVFLVFDFELVQGDATTPTTTP
jgi:hypothetical protein